MAETIETQVRNDLGTRSTRRLRRAGAVPAILYGHGQPNVNLSMSAEQLEAAVRHGSRLIMLSGAVSERAFIRDLQWDTWGNDVLHVDLTRVSEHEKVEVHVAIELRGEAPGVKAGGVIQHLIHEVKVECEVTAIPEKLFVKVNHLEIGQSITVGQMELPLGVKLDLDPEEVVVQCVEPVEEVEEEAAGESGAVEPEIIGRKKEEEGEAEE
jgi:large subunit ribosomal protein L25